MGARRDSSCQKRILSSLSLVSTAKARVKFVGRDSVKRGSPSRPSVQVEGLPVQGALLNLQRGESHGDEHCLLDVMIAQNDRACQFYGRQCMSAP